MLRWGIVCAVAALLFGVAEARAQLPSPGSSGMTYKIVSPSNSPLAAPIPSFGTAKPKPSFFGRFYETLAKFLPFVPAKKPTLAPPMPTSQKLPTAAGPGVQIQQTGAGIPLPQTPQPR